MNGILHEDQYKFFTSNISRLFLFIMRNVEDKICRENQNTHFVFSNVLSKTVQCMRKWRKILYSGAGHN
jgi:hypothetical protein